MFHKAVDLKFREGTTLDLKFQTGETKRYDVHTLFGKYPALRALEDRKLFLSGKLTGSYGIIWNDDLDLDAETVYADGETIRTGEIPPCSAIGQMFMAARAKADLTQKELAEASGINQADISRIERGIANPSVNTLSRLASALGVTLKILLE